MGSSLGDLTPKRGLSDDDVRIGWNLARLRKERGLSQSALAETMREAGHGWHQNTVSRIENGQQSMAMSEMEMLETVLGGGLLAGTDIQHKLQAFAAHAADRSIERELAAAESALAQAAEAVALLRRAVAVRKTTTPMQKFMETQQEAQRKLDELGRGGGG